MSTIENKILSYMGFAAKARKLVTGYNTCIYMMEKGKVKLLILTENLAENTVKKMTQVAEAHNVPYRMYGDREELSRCTGNVDKAIYGIIDNNFAKVILDGIDQIQSV